MGKYRVIAAVAQFTLPAPTGPMLQYIYQGGIVPDGVSQDEIDHHLEGGLIEEFDSPFDALPAGINTPLSQAADPGDDPDGPGGAPAKSANKADWVAYAVSQGHDEAEADALTKDQLVELYYPAS